MIAVPTTPERSLEQRQRALAVANRVRSTRAEGKRQLAADRTYSQLMNLLGWRAAPAGELEDYATMKVVDVLLAAPRFGRVKVMKALNRVRISPSKTLGGLTGRQRYELLRELDRLVVYAAARRGASRTDEAWARAA